MIHGYGGILSCIQPNKYWLIVSQKIIFSGKRRKLRGKRKQKTEYKIHGSLKKGTEHFQMERSDMFERREQENEKEREWGKTWKR